MAKKNDITVSEMRALLPWFLAVNAVYFALGNVAILDPAITSLYFDIFSAVIQAYIFTTLTMAYISGAECE